MKHGVSPIGTVKKGVLHIHKRWRKALRGIDGFSHVMVFFWLHKTHKPDLTIHPKGNIKIPKIGYLATRTPHRANPIGMTVVKRVRRKGTAIWVKGLDVWDGTPVIDVKPYTKKDAIGNYRIPEWVKRLDRLESDPLRKYGT